MSIWSEMSSLRFVFLSPNWLIAAAQHSRRVPVLFWKRNGKKWELRFTYFCRLQCFFIDFLGQWNKAKGAQVAGWQNAWSISIYLDALVIWKVFGVFCSTKGYFGHFPTSNYPFIIQVRGQKWSFHKWAGGRIAEFNIWHSTFFERGTASQPTPRSTRYGFCILGKIPAQNQILASKLDV